MVFAVATNNQKKLKEIQRILDSFGITAKTLKELNISVEIEENGTTFEENAYIKAKSACDETGLPCIADDSGLCVEYLGGGPGVYSARYAGEPCDDQRNNEKLLKNLEGIGDRSAAFVCTIACVIPEGQPLAGDPIIGMGYCPGEILFNPRGNAGFGYDPLFWFDPFGKTFAEMSAEEKNAISHRGSAVKAFASASLAQ